MSATRALPAEHEKAAAVEAMFDRIAPRYDRMNRLLTFRLDVGWRRRAVTALQLAAGATVLDLACGTGDMCNDLQHAGFGVVGVDFSAGMLGAATTTAPLVRADVLRLPVPDGSIDGITCGFALRNLTALPPFFAACATALRSGGRVRVPRRRGAALSRCSAPVTRSISGASCPSSAVSSATAPRTRTCPLPPRTSPSRPSSWRSSAQQVSPMSVTSDSASVPRSSSPPHADDRRPVDATRRAYQRGRPARRRGRHAGCAGQRRLLLDRRRPRNHRRGHCRARARRTRGRGVAVDHRRRRHAVRTHCVRRTHVRRAVGGAADHPGASAANRS